MSVNETIKHAEGQFGGTIEHQVITPSDPVPGGPRPHPRGNGEVLVLKSGYEVQTIDGPKRGRRLHLFHDLASIAAWLNRHATDHAKTEIVMNAQQLADQKRKLGHVVAHLDPRGVDGDVVECEIAQHPVFLAWLAILGKQLDQVTLAEHVRCYRDSLGADGSALLAALQQIKVTVGGTTEMQVGSLGEIRLLAGDRRNEASITIPPEVFVRTAIFDGVMDGANVEAEYMLRLFVSMKFVGEGENKHAAFMLTCPDLAIVLRKALHDAHQDLVTRLDADFLVGFGVARVDHVPDLQ